MPIDTAVAEKLIFTIPPVRVDEPLFIALAQHSASIDRSPSYIVREALRAYLESHGRMVAQPEEAAK